MAKTAERSRLFAAERARTGKPDRRVRREPWLGRIRETPIGTRSSWLSPFPTRRVAFQPEALPLAEQHAMAAGYSEFKALGDAPGAFDEIPGSGRRAGLAGDLFE